MALIIYSNGILEEERPEKNIFNFSELSDFFTEFDTVKSHRFIELANTWILWGVKDGIPDILDFNKVGQFMTGEDIFSHVVVIHDSELGDNKFITDTLYNSYDNFKENLNKYLVTVIEDILKEDEISETMDEESNPDNMLLLDLIGKTKDKRALLSFNPQRQKEEFYNNGWEIFAESIYKYISSNDYKNEIDNDNRIVIYADKKSVIVVDDINLENVLNNLLDNFKDLEDYNKCSIIHKIMKEEKII